MSGGTVGIKVELALLDAVFHLATGAVELFVKVAGLVLLACQRGDDKPRIGFASGPFRLGDDPPFAAPALARLPDEVLEAACRLFGPSALLGGVAEKALAMGRAEEAERLLSSALADVIEASRAGRPSPSLVDIAARFAAKLATATGKGAWADVYKRLALGMILAFAALVGLSLIAVHGDYQTGSPADVGWMLPFWFAAWAAATASSSLPLSRFAMAVVNRSSYVSTGIGQDASSSATKASVSPAWRPRRPCRSGRPSTAPHSSV